MQHFAVSRAFAVGESPTEGADLLLSYLALPKDPAPIGRMQLRPQMKRPAGTSGGPSSAAVIG